MYRVTSFPCVLAHSIIMDVAKSTPDATLGHKRGNEAEETPSTPTGRPVKWYKLVEVCPPTKKKSHPAMAAQLGFFKLKGSP